MKPFGCANFFVENRKIVKVNSRCLNAIQKGQRFNVRKNYSKKKK